MKKTIALLLVSMLIMVSSGCHNPNATPDNTQVGGPFTNDNSADFANSIPATIDNKLLQACYEYSETCGYAIKNKEKYKSVLLDEANIGYVSLDDDSKREMLNENDLLIIFDEIRIVLDADTGAVLGRIPYV